MQNIASRDNPLVKQAVRLRESAAERRERGLFFLEGHRLCADALASGFVPETVFCTKAARQKYDTQELETAAQVFEVSEAVAAKLGDTQNPQGIFALFATRAPSEDFWCPTGTLAGRYIALEQVQDPGNLGAIARTAEALGLDGLLCSGGCDPFHPKAQRAAMGSLLRLPVLICADLCAALREASSRGCRTFAAVPGAEAIPVTQVDFSGAGAIVAIGNEGGGLSQMAIDACDARITIPMAGRAESLNAAAAATILMWCMGQA